MGLMACLVTTALVAWPVMTPWMAGWGTTPFQAATTTMSSSAEPATTACPAMPATISIASIWAMGRTASTTAPAPTGSNLAPVSHRLMFRLCSRARTISSCCCRAVSASRLSMPCQRPRTPSKKSASQTAHFGPTPTSSPARCCRALALTAAPVRRRPIASMAGSVTTTWAAWPLMTASMAGPVTTRFPAATTTISSSAEPAMTASLAIPAMTSTASTPATARTALPIPAGSSASNWAPALRSAT